MIKKVIALFVVIFTAFSVNAQSLPKSVDMMSFDEVKEIMKDPKKNEDLLVQMLFSIPPEYHQYVMPMIGDLYGISERVRMMPGIVEWRRKVPTRIAPQLQDFAKEHLLYLNPAFYPYLMPEMWPEEETEGHSHQSEFVPKIAQVSSAEELERAFPSSIKRGSLLERQFSDEYKHKPQENKNPTLTGKDVDSVVTVMNKLRKLGHGSQGRERRNTLILDYQNMDLLIEAHINPCQSLISHLDKIEADKWFENQVKAENMTVPEFTKKCDAVIKAYRMKLAAPGVLLAIREEVKGIKKLPKEAHQRRLVEALVHMFETTKSDLDAIEGKEEELNKTFHEKILFLGTPVLLDF